MGWKVEVSDHAAAQIGRMDTTVARRIYAFLGKLEKEQDPFKLLIPYQSNMAGLWKKRIGDYRIVIEPNRGKLLLLVLKAGHRSKIYKK